MGSHAWEQGVGGGAVASAHDAEESRMLDEEIEFRQSPVFEDYRVEPSVPLPANLLEFPRQLVAAKRVRPQLALGPLLAEEARGTRGSQLRIFEVEPEQLSAMPAITLPAPEWSSIWLDAHTVTEPIQRADAHSPTLMEPAVPQPAALRQRAKATAIDLGLVAVGMGCFGAAFARLVGEFRMGGAELAGAGGVLLLLYLLYQVLFFTLTDQTPGMRLARIGLCTFADENPSRSAMRRRIVAQVVAVCPLGLGVLWILLDEDGLGWHDRISKMYQRAY